MPRFKMENASETVSGRYEFRKKIAAGPMSTVYEGWDSTIQRRVAIKEVPLVESGWEQLARFRREAQAAGRLQHPHIVAIFDYYETSRCAYIVMEYVEGSTLKTAVDKGIRLTLAAVGRVMDDVLTGLQYSHEQGVVHRDLKPSNIMMTRDGRAKIADFGIARLEDSSITQVGAVMGTPAYMSPEQFRGEAIDASTDIYSAGIILYELLTGGRPFDGGIATIMHKALNTVPPKPSDISDAVPRLIDGVVFRAMAKRPQQRFGSAVEFAEALRHGLAVEPVKPTQRPIAAGRPRPSLAWTPPSRKAYIIAGAVVAVMAAAGGTAMYLRSTAQSGRAAKPDIQATAPSPDAGSARTSADAAATGGQGNPAGATDNAASASLGPGHGVDRVQPADLPVQSFPSPPPVAATNAPPVAPTSALPVLPTIASPGTPTASPDPVAGWSISGRGARAAEDDHPGWPGRRVRAAIERVASPAATGPAAARRNAGVASRADKEGPAACAREPGSL